MFREITPLTGDDCFLVFDRFKQKFDFPLHVHSAFELNFIKGAKGAIRVVGDHVSAIGNYELVMVGPNIFHGWEQGNSLIAKKHEITIQFHHDLFDESLLSKNIFNHINRLLKEAGRGIAFSEKTVKRVMPLLLSLVNTKDMQSFLSLLTLLDQLSLELDHAEILSPFVIGENTKDIQMKKISDFIRQSFAKKITLEEAATHMNMTIITFSRLIKRNTGMSFIEFLNEFRINYAVRLLLETNKRISEITEMCGFNNQAHFNRLFKLRRGCAPTEFLHLYQHGIRKTY